MAQYADMPSTSSACVKVEYMDDLTFDLPADLLDLSLEPPDELDLLGSESTASDDFGPSTVEAKYQPKRQTIQRADMPVQRSSRGWDLKTTVRCKSEVFNDDDTMWTPPDELDQSGSESTASDDPGPSTAEGKYQPKRRTRQTTQRPDMPVQRSSRGRDLKTTVRYKSEGFKDDDTTWTVPERRRLLAALKEHGSSDVSKLAQAVRTRSAAAVSHFLLERRRLKDRIVIQGSAGKRAAYSTRVLRRALNVIRRRYDRSQYLPQAVAACERRLFRGPTEDSIGEMPQFEDLYQMIRELMENHVPAALGDCELWLFKRLLWTLGNTIRTLDLDATRKDVHEALLWAAAQPPDGYSKPAGQDNEQSQVPPTGDSARRSLNFPSMKERKDGLRSSWDPLRMPTSAVQRPWAVIREYLATKPSRRTCVKMERPSTSTATGATASTLASRKKKKTTTTTTYEPRTLDAFRAWKN